MSGSGLGVLVSILISLFFCIFIIWLEPVENYLPRDIKVIINNLKKKERGGGEPKVVIKKPPTSGPVVKPLKPLKPGDMKPVKLSQV